MKESTVYPAIFADGEVQGRREGRLEGRLDGLQKGREEGERIGTIRARRDLILRLGEKRLGPVTAEVALWLESVVRLEEPDAIADRLLEAEYWNELRGG